MPDIQFTGLHLNLQQGLVHSNHAEACNCVCAIFDKHKQRVVIRPDYSPYGDQILDAISALNPERPIKYEVLYGDGFTVDTWNKLLNPQLGSELG